MFSGLHWWFLHCALFRSRRWGLCRDQAQREGDQAQVPPRNRLALHSVPANRPEVRRPTGGQRQPGTTSRELTGADINETTLAQVPNAVHADTADSARTAQDAQTAINAINAVNADKINGHSAGCLQGTRPFAGACWEASSHGPGNRSQRRR